LPGSVFQRTVEETNPSTWRREVGRRMVAFVKAVGGLITRYDTIKRTASTEEASRAQVACDAALDELERLSVALRQFRRSLHSAPVASDVAPHTSWRATLRESSTSQPPAE
jgi:hypothetical protein